MEHTSTILPYALAAVSALLACSCRKDSVVCEPHEIISKSEGVTVSVCPPTMAKSSEIVCDTVRVGGRDDGIQILAVSEPYGDDFPSTKVSEVTAVSSLYLERTYGSGVSEKVINATQSFPITGGRITTFWYVPSSSTQYNYYLSNAGISFSCGGSTIDAATTKDIVAGYARSAAEEVSVQLGHIFARTGSITPLTAPSGATVSNEKWYLESVTGGTAGTYNMETGKWSSVTALPQTSFTGSSDLYLVPGEYTVKLSYTLSKGNWTNDFVKTGILTMEAGRKLNFIANAEDVQISYEAPDVSVSAQWQSGNGFEYQYNFGAQIHVWQVSSVGTRKEIPYSDLTYTLNSDCKGTYTWSGNIQGESSFSGISCSTTGYVTCPNDFPVLYVDGTNACYSGTTSVTVTCKNASWDSFKPITVTVNWAVSADRE